MEYTVLTSAIVASVNIPVSKVYSAINFTCKERESVLVLSWVIAWRKWFVLVSSSSKEYSLVVVRTLWCLEWTMRIIHLLQYRQPIKTVHTITLDQSYTHFNLQSLCYPRVIRSIMWTNIRCWQLLCFEIIIQQSLTEKGDNSMLLIPNQISKLINMAKHNSSWPQRKAIEFEWGIGIFIYL